MHCENDGLQSSPPLFSVGGQEFIQMNVHNTQLPVEGWANQPGYILTYMHPGTSQPKTVAIRHILLPPHRCTTEK
jgi:hypothetical protein